MSHIDSYSHQLVGYLAGLPVYRPLVDIEGDEDFGDFSCKAGQLVLGGGSGEWPGLVLEKPATAVATFLVLCEEESVSDRGWLDLADGQAFEKGGLRYYAWRTEDHARFYTLCQSEALPYPYEDKADYSFEQWLLATFGQLVFHAFPEMASELMDQLDDPWTALKHNHFNNILLPVPNAPTYANGGQVFHPVLRERR